MRLLIISLALLLFNIQTFAKGIPHCIGYDEVKIKESSSLGFVFLDNRYSFTEKKILQTVKFKNTTIAERKYLLNHTLSLPVSCQDREKEKAQHLTIWVGYPLDIQLNNGTLIWKDQVLYWNNKIIPARTVIVIQRNGEINSLENFNLSLNINNQKDINAIVEHMYETQRKKPGCAC